MRFFVRWCRKLWGFCLNTRSEQYGNKTGKKKRTLYYQYWIDYRQAFIAQWKYFYNSNITFLWMQFHKSVKNDYELPVPNEVLVCFKTRKGWLISEATFLVFIWTQKWTNYFFNFCASPKFLPQPLKMGRIKKMKSLYSIYQGAFNIIDTFIFWFDLF